MLTRDKSRYTSARTKLGLYLPEKHIFLGTVVSVSLWPSIILNNSTNLDLRHDDFPWKSLWPAAESSEYGTNTIALTYAFPVLESSSNQPSKGFFREDLVHNFTSEGLKAIESKEMPLIFPLSSSKKELTSDNGSHCSPTAACFPWAVIVLERDYNPRAVTDCHDRAAGASTAALSIMKTTTERALGGAAKPEEVPPVIAFTFTGFESNLQVSVWVTFFSKGSVTLKIPDNTVRLPFSNTIAC